MPTIGPFAVHVHDSSGKLHSFLPGESVPEWAVALMGDHCFAAAVAAAIDYNLANAHDTIRLDGEGGTTSSGDGPPPTNGPGGGRDTWATYAQSHGVSVSDGWKRDQIIAACKDAGVPVE